MGQYFTNDKLESNMQKKEIYFADKKFNFFTDNGVFCKKGLDFGSRILLDTLIKENIYGDVLDVGCGVGVLGIILASFFDINITMIDVNKRALHLTDINIKENHILNAVAFESNVYENIDAKYDFIITNPPIRAGKMVYYKILFEAKKHLNENGTLYFVMSKNQGAKSAMKDLGLICDVCLLQKSKEFFVIKCVF